MPKILIIDDDPAVCSSLKILLKKRGFEAISVGIPTVAIDTVQAHDPDLILLDMNFTIDTSGRQGLALLRQIKEQDKNRLVILMTGWATVQLAVEGMKLGAKDFLAKPWDNDHLIRSINTVLQLEDRNTSSADELPTNEEGFLIGQSSVFLEVLDMAKRVANTEASVLITGESGTGKELIAEAIHRWSKRSDEEFVKVNLGGISSSLFESEMFGHKKGAFTDAHSDRVGRFEKANGGTIFLDEIGELPLANQVKLLRVLQERTYEVLGSSVTRKTDVRIISATNKFLPGLVDAAEFREDLFYRINLITLILPPLRDRPEDIKLLTKYFIKNVSAIYDVDPPRIDEESFSWLSRQPYPGNIRQLKNIVDRTLLLNLGKKRLSWKDFRTNMSGQVKTEKVQLPGVGTMSLEEMERQMIKKALSFHHHSISATAQSLGITRSSLYRRLEKYGIPHEPKI